MKNSFLFTIALFCGFLIVLNSCTNKNPDGTRIIKEYYKNKVLKAEISVKDTLRQGITKNYDSMGKLMSTANFVNNQKDGIAKNYYTSGVVQQEMFYKKDLLEGEAKMFYKSGKLYMKTFYESNKKQGLEQTFYESGKLQSEIEYNKGFAGTGLKEYNEQGKLLKLDPSINIREIHPPFNNKLILEISLSNHVGNVKFYMDTLLNNKFMHTNMKLNSIFTENGIGRIEWNKFNVIQMKKLNIVAEITTSRRNKLIIQRSYNLVIK